MFMRKMRKDSRGLTLIELVIAAAILGIISATIGGALVVATNAYRSGSVQTALQTEAQFTVNAIEGLIIDATDTVEFSGNVLTIANVDYTYVIVFDPGAQTLTYTQYDTNTGAAVMDPAVQLLAEHVKEFDVYADDFPTTRNARITITMENAGKEFTTNYNITSRNNPDAGETIEMTAVIGVETEIILEPNQIYQLNVNVMGPANKSFTPQFEPEGDHTPDISLANITDSSVDIHVGPTETGGVDQLLRLRITSNATGDYTFVTVRIRRALSINLTGPNLKSGTALKQDAVYTLSSEVVCSNPDKAMGKAYDNDYVDPRTQQWSFETTTGENGNDYAEILYDTGESSELTFRLKQDLPTGMTLRIKSTSQHQLWRNKTNSLYSQDVYAYKELVAENGGLRLQDSMLRRGDECYVDSDLDPQKLVEEEWRRNHPGEEQPWEERYNAGFTGNIYFRYVSSDNTHSSDGYPGWVKMKEQGNNPTTFKFNAGDFEGMYFMKDYTIEILFSFKYNKGNNQQAYYPASAFPDGSGVPIANVDPQYIYTFPMYALSMGFESYKDGLGVGHDCDSYWTANGCGLGTFNRPLELAYGNDMYLGFNIFTGATAEKGGTLESLLSYSQLYKWNGSSWDINSREIQYTDRHDKQYGTIRIGLQNAQIQKGVTYKLVFEKVTGPEIEQENGQKVRVIETYAYEPVDGLGGRGVLYLRFY